MKKLTLTETKTLLDLIERAVKEKLIIVFSKPSDKNDIAQLDDVVDVKMNGNAIQLEIKV